MSWLIRLFLFIASLFSAYQLGQEMAAKPQIRKPEPAVVYQSPPSLPPQQAEHQIELPRSERHQTLSQRARTGEAEYGEQVNRIKRQLEYREERINQPVRVIVEVQLPRPNYRSPRPVYYVAAPPRSAVQRRANPNIRYIHY